jgi:hypothetical protein
MTLTKPVVLAAALLAGGCSGSLDDLAARHRATTDPPAGVEEGGLVFLASPRHWGTDKFSGGVNGSGVRQAFTDDGVFLEIGTPGLKKAVWIPLSAIAGCSRSRAPGGLHLGRTGLWIADSQVLIRYADERGRVLKWCAQRGLKVSDDTIEATWLQKKDATHEPR